MLRREMTIKRINKLPMIEAVVEAIQRHKIQYMPIPAFVLVLLIVIVGLHQVTAILQYILMQLLELKTLRRHPLNRVGVEVIDIISVGHKELNGNAVVVFDGEEEGFVG